jgi:polar amino acid transport system substrate-binding protein
MYMKRFLASILVLLLALSASAFALAEEDQSLAAIQEKGQFILGLDAHFLPMGYLNEQNEIVGFDIDLAKEVCARLGVELVTQPIEWAAKELELATGNIDCIWNGMSVTPEREESMALSDAYLSNDMILVVKADGGIATRDDLQGKVLAVQSGSYAEELIEGEGLKAVYDTLAEVLAYEDYLMAIMDLQNDNVAAVFIDSVMAEFLLADLGDENLIIVENLEADRFAVGFRKEDVALRDKVNEIFKEMKADGAMGEIATAWFGSDTTIISAE